MKKYKMKDYDANSPGFLGRERLKLAVLQASQKYIDSGKLEDEIPYFEAMVDFLEVYTDAPADELEQLSVNDLNGLYNKVIDHITANEEPDPKASDSTAE